MVRFIFQDIQGVDILSGGVGGFGYAVPIAKNRYWVDWFWCTQFIVVYKKFFQKILDYEFKDTDTADGVISMLSNNLMTLYPFISKQKKSLSMPYYILLVRTKKMREEEDVLSRNIVMYKMQYYFIYYDD